MMSKWTDDITVRFVEMYRDRQVLWDVMHPNYRSKGQREKALLEIIETLAIRGFGLPEAKMKIKNLRSTYGQEVAKIERSRMMAAAPHDVYVPSVKWFNIMDSFLSRTKTHEANIGINDFLYEQKNDEIEDPFISEIVMANYGDDQKDDVSEGSNNDSSSKTISSTPWTEGRPRQESRSSFDQPIKRRRANEVTLQNKNETSHSGDNHDEIDTFGRYLALQLKKLPPKLSLMAQQEMQNVITRYRLEALQSQPSTPSLAFESSQLNGKKFSEDNFTYE